MDNSNHLFNGVKKKVILNKINDILVLTYIENYGNLYLNCSYNALIGFVVRKKKTRFL